MPANAARYNALHKANEVRLDRARLHRRIANGGREAPTLLAELLLDPPAELANAEIGDVLLWLPHYGDSRVRKLLARHRINELAHINGQLGERTVAVLTDRQRRILAHALTSSQRTVATPTTSLSDDTLLELV
jgi:hypothetical protein